LYSTQEPVQEEIGGASLRSEPPSTDSDGAASTPERPDLKVVASSRPTIESRAAELLTEWWDDRKARGLAVPAQPFIQIRKILHAPLSSGRPVRLIWAGLTLLQNECRAVSGGSLTNAMRDAARHPAAPEEFRRWAGVDDAGRSPANAHRPQTAAARANRDKWAGRTGQP
jgi:hypothetical protein